MNHFLPFEDVQSSLLSVFSDSLSSSLLLTYEKKHTKGANDKADRLMLPGNFYNFEKSAWLQTEMVEIISDDDDATTSKISSTQGNADAKKEGIYSKIFKCLQFRTWDSDIMILELGLSEGVLCMSILWSVFICV